ncbi:MAG: hypothetical protein NTV97_10730 [Alphaproteobacteria bacterium]|nr:hypothetical protein [Alphaproteobacteria bacterium]
MADSAPKQPLVELLKRRGIVVPVETVAEIERAAEKLERMAALLRQGRPAPHPAA